MRRESHTPTSGQKESGLLLPIAGRWVSINDLRSKYAANGQTICARRFSRPSPLFRWAESRSYFSSPSQGLLFGAGLLVEASALADRGWSVDAVELPQTIVRHVDEYLEWSRRPDCRILVDLQDLRPLYDVIIVTHVLEFIENRRKREKILKTLARHLAPKGKLLLSLRGWSDVNAARKREKSGDGVITGLGTWTRGYSLDEAIHLIASAGLSVSESPSGIRARHPEQVRIICQHKTA
ncbi:methyltransferase domain-containing protein [Nonomuraea sp. NPDC050691]|uniref:class I SAM-dependent methyltransferase n=1 Tax=Nonomuraea sp. NPDC050691 TaxID=3155661 RepID=UPI0033EE8075